MKPRIIARLDIKNDHVIKGIHLEGLRKVGAPKELAKKYYDMGVDEILFIDPVASLYQRNSLFQTLKEASEEVFIPLTIGGGLRSVEDVSRALDSGADKISINTAALKNPNLISETARIYGSQCVVISIEAKKNPSMPCGYEAYNENGRNKTQKDVLEWTREVQALGAGEVLLTSIDQEGTKKGFDLDLCKLVNQGTSLPVLASGGCGKQEHLDQLTKHCSISGVVLASALHYELFEIISEHRS
jgi:imidazole glycerol-phosphate synthase subunit HisF